jgi:hypothetical protein
MFTAFPLLAIPALLYNLYALTAIVGNNAATAGANLKATLFPVTMPGGRGWDVSSGDLFILLGLVMLFFELLRATNTNKVAIINHSLSMILFIFCLVEFLLVPAFATSTFFLLTTMTLLDVLAGFIVTIVAARKDFEFSGNS